MSEYAATDEYDARQHSHRVPVPRYRATPELWERVSESDGVYLWMVWQPGRIGSDGAHWFKTKDEALAMIERLDLG